MTHWSLRLAALLAALGLGACAHVTNDAELLCETPGCYTPNTGYRFEPRKSTRNTLVVVTLSGGGVRAAALAYGTLLALNELPGTVAPGAPRTLLDDVDIVSSVSGGSVTAGWYALQGKADGLKPGNALEQFLYADNMASLVWRVLNPVAVTGYLATEYQRSDALIDYFANRLFHAATFEDVETRYRRANDLAANQPFVILNATDLGNETGFPFTQNRFDLLCSDLSRYKLADAVAASANFPLAFSAIGLRNYSDRCPAHQGEVWRRTGPPRWIDVLREPYDAKDDDWAGRNAKARESNGLIELRAARTAHDYIDTAQSKNRVVHLLDGGLVDNLGIRSTFALEDDSACSPGLFQRLLKTGPPSYQRIDQVLYVVVNARSRTPARIDTSRYPPDLASTLLRVIDTPVDSTILSSQDYLTAELHAMRSYPDLDPTTAAGKHKPRPFVPRAVSAGGDCWCGKVEDADRDAPADSARDKRRGGCIKLGARPAPRALPFAFNIVSIDFELIPHKRCRDKFWELTTSWSLDHEAIDELIQLPRIMLRRSVELARFYDAIRPGEDVVEKLKATAFPGDFAAVCLR